MALALGGNTLMPLAARALPGLLADGDWRQRHAALICLAQIAEGCVKAMLGHLDSLVSMCLQVSQQLGARLAPHMRACLRNTFLQTSTRAGMSRQR